MKQKLSNERRHLYLVIMIIITVLFFLIYQFNCDIFSIGRGPSKTSTKSSPSKYLIDTPGCKIPNMDPFDKNILRFIEEPKNYTCNDGLPSLFESNLTSISLLNSSLPFYNIRNTSYLKCCYKTFWRLEPNDDEKDNKIQYSNSCVLFVNHTIINDEFIAVYCFYKHRYIYKDMFSFVPTANISKYHDNNFKKPLNVLLIGLDAISRLNFHRQMPKTVDLLHRSGAVELLGYNKVGDNTFPNLIPVLTGKSVNDLRNECWSKDTFHFDNCSFIWKDFKRKGYVTAYGEDSSWMGLFNYQKNGFKRQPTDFAYNYFSEETESKMGNNHFLNVDLCEGGRWVYKDLLKYATKFVATMRSNYSPFFGFFWESSLSHDDLNMPKLGDEDFYLFFKHLRDDKLLDNTVLFVLSDHGIRWGEIRTTFQGAMEERLPFLFVLLPKMFTTTHRKYFKNLVTNARRLTTPFDLHQTLLHLSNISVDRHEVVDLGDRRGVSLFEEISPERTCGNAAISSHWCTCQRSIEINNKSKILTRAGRFVVLRINNRLKRYRHCAKLILDDVLNGRLMKPNEEISGIYQIEDYTISLRTTPGGAIFEATVRYISELDTFSILGSVSRLNMYGQQSACISDYRLKLYCFCDTYKYK